jgi:hypothetical protein
MQTINLRYKLHLYWRKIVVSVLLLGFGFSSIAQNNPTDNLINYENQWIHYGFLIGVHSSKYVIRYSDAFVTSPSQDSVHSIIPGNLGGFKLGFISNMKLAQYLDFRASITVGFYENDLLYRFTNNTNHRELKEATRVEFPLLLKYKSARRGNVAMYLVAGINPSFEASSKDSREDVVERLELTNWNMAIDVGVGLDIFYPYFKFSPEIRYSYGLTNRLSDEINDFNVGLSKLTSQNLGIFITFEGGPDSKNKTRSRTKGAGQIKSRKRKRSNR